MFKIRCDNNERKLLVMVYSLVSGHATVRFCFSDGEVVLESVAKEPKEGPLVSDGNG